MAKLDNLKGSVQVFFTDEGTGARYRAFPDGTYIFVKSPKIEERMKGVLDAQGIDYADESKPVDRDIYGIENVDPRKLVREFLQPALAGKDMPK